MEFDPKIWWSRLCILIRDAMDRGKVSPNDITGISTTSFRQGIVLLNEMGKEIHSAPNIDFRATKESTQLMKDYGEEIYRTTGKHPFPHFAISGLLWLKEPPSLLLPTPAYIPSTPLDWVRKSIALNTWKLKTPTIYLK